MTDYGTDVSTFPVTDMTGRTISGPRVVAECLLRRYTTPNGSLDYDPDFGFDLRYLLGEDLTESDLRAVESAAVREALKDERVASAWVQLDLNIETQKLTVRIGGELADGESFDFVLAIDNVTSAVLSVN